MSRIMAGSVMVKEKIDLTKKEEKIVKHLLYVVKHFELEIRLHVTGGWVHDKATGLEGDVRKQEDTARVLGTTVKHFRKLDILVNGATSNFLISPKDLLPNGF
ncbi:uncharacterized protein A4U43_C01F18080 [Asparagus officinalis]|uniref:Uncharacterized protein n=1 Tax=Asparagus officinalis TaxID=4686 RepID=A0A5P1FQV5_ASPOF|nr:uncharacterized protein A4U43_C01F18080 [Asparagus officinalis]